VLGALPGMKYNLSLYRLSHEGLSLLFFANFGKANDKLIICLRKEEYLMTANLAKENWYEKTLEKPFFEAEMARVDITKARPGEENTFSLVLLTCYSVVFGIFCSYSAIKYLL
jgi:hypothetical protein